MLQTVSQKLGITKQKSYINLYFYKSEFFIIIYETCKDIHICFILSKGQYSK